MIARTLCAVAPALLLAAPAFSQTILADWEQTPDGFSHVNPLGYSDTTGVTSGTYSLAVDVPNGYSNSLRGGVGATGREAVLTNNTISVDFTKLEGGDPATGGGGIQLNFLIQGQSASSAFFQMQSNAETFYAPGAGTLTWDYRTVFGTLPAEDGGGYINVWIITNAIGGPYAPTIYFDNLRVEGAAMRVPGDADNDGDVDVSDLGILASNFRMMVTNGPDGADFDESGTVDVSDLGILAANFRFGTSSTNSVDAFINAGVDFGLPRDLLTAAVPEPVTLSALAAAGLLLRRRR